MSYVVGAVTLPVVRSVTEHNPARISSLGQDGDAPVVFCEGLDIRELEVDATVYVAVSSKAALKSSYITPLQALVGTEVALAFPDSHYDGSWVFKSFTFTEGLKSFGCRLVFVRGSSHVVL